MVDRNITVTVKLFAAFQEAYGLSELHWEFPRKTPVVEILNRCIQEHPELEQWRNLTRFGINLEFATADTLLKQGDEVALIPPVSGGSDG